MSAVYIDSKTHKEVKVDERSLKDIIERYDANHDHEEKRKWYLNLAFYVGDQWVVFDDHKGQVVRPNAPSWRVRLTVNHVLPTVRTEFAKLTAFRHQWEVIAATAEEADINVARAATKFLDSKWRELDMDDIREEVVLWALTCGTGFIKTWWDETIGPDEPTLVEGEDDLFLPMGDISVTTVSPFEIIPDPMATSVRDAKWIIHAKAYTPQEVEDLYGKKVSPDQEETVLDVWKSKVSSLLGFRTGETTETETVTVREMWERPSKKHPEGRLVVATPSELLYSGPNPMPQGELPFVAFKHIKVPGKFWGMSGIEQMIPIQKELNKTRSQIIESKNRMAKPALLVHEASGVDSSMLTGEPGQVIPWKGNIPPMPLKMPSLPNFVLQEPDRCLADIERISGIHEVSHGSAPPGVKSGVAIRYLQEQDDTKLGPTARGFERSFQELACLWLKLAKHYYHPQEARIVKYVGINREVQVMDFDAWEMPIEPDVIVISGSSLPESKTARQEFLKELFALGVFMDEQGKPDTQKFLRMLELGGVDEVFDDITTDLNASEIENRMMARGEMQDVHEWDNHRVHIYNHNKYRKNSTFMEFPPETRELFGRHLKVHEAALSGNVPWDFKGDVDVEALAQEVMSPPEVMPPSGIPPMGEAMPPGLPPPGGDASPIGEMVSQMMEQMPPTNLQGVG